MSDILVSLTVLGIIASILIPKILGEQQIKSQKAITKEAYSTVYNLMYACAQNPSCNDVVTYIFDNLQAVKICRNNGLAQGCRTVVTGVNNPEAATWPTAVLHNGATVHILSYGFGSAGGVPYNNKAFALTIDANGDKGPNGWGGDIYATWLGNANDYDLPCPNLSYTHPKLTLKGWCGVTDPLFLVP